jgi:hypothetical protein
LTFIYLSIFLFPVETGAPGCPGIDNLPFFRASGPGNFHFLPPWAFGEAAHSIDSHRLATARSLQEVFAFGFDLQ